MSTPIPPDRISADEARRTARNVGALVVASLLSKGILFGWQILLGQWLGPFQYGVYNTVLALMAVGAPIASFSMGLIIIRQVARDPQSARAYMTAALFSQTMLSLVAYAAILVGGITADYSDLILAYAAIAALSLFVDFYGSLCSDMLIAQERMVLTASVDIVHIVLRVSLAGVALSLGWGLLGIYAATLFSGILRSSALGWVAARRGLSPVWPLDRPLLRRLLIDSFPLTVTAFLSLAYQHTDKLMTTSILGETNTGYLAPAFIISFGVIELISTTILVATYPLMSRYHSQGGTVFGFIVEKLARFMLIVTLPVALVLSIYADPIIMLLFGPAYAPTAGILQVLIWYTMLTMVGNVFAKALLIQNRQRWLLVIRVTGLSLNIALTSVLLLQYRDPRGAAIASVIAEMLILSMLAGSFRSKGFEWARIWRSLLWILALAAFAGLAMLLLAELFLLGAGLGLLIYALGLLRGPILSEEDWDLLYRMVAAMPGGTFIRRYWHRQTSINW